MRFLYTNVHTALSICMQHSCMFWTSSHKNWLWRNRLSAYSIQWPCDLEIRARSLKLGWKYKYTFSYIMLCLKESMSKACAEFRKTSRISLQSKILHFDGSFSYCTEVAPTHAGQYSFLPSQPQRLYQGDGQISIEWRLSALETFPFSHKWMQSLSA